MEKSVLLEKRKELENLIIDTKGLYEKFAGYCNLYELPLSTQEKITNVYEQIRDNEEFVKKGRIKFVTLEKLINDYKYVNNSLKNTISTLDIDIAKSVPTIVTTFNAERMYNYANEHTESYTAEEKAYMKNPVKFQTDYIYLRAAINGTSKTRRDFTTLSSIIKKAYIANQFTDKVKGEVVPTIPLDDNRVKSIDEYVVLLDAFVSKRLKGRIKKTEEVKAEETVETTAETVEEVKAEETVETTAETVEEVKAEENKNETGFILIDENSDVPSKNEETTNTTTLIPVSPVYDDDLETRRVKEIERANEEQEKKNRRSLRTLASVILAGVALMTIIVLAKSCNRNKDIKPVDTTDEPGIETTAEPIETEAPVIIPAININNETQLEEYAKYIQDELKKNGVDMSVEDIKNAIKLVNVDYLDEKPFSNREQVYNATEDAGKIATKLGTTSVLAEDPAYQNNLITERTLDDMIKNVVPGYNKANLNLTKNENGYSIYELLDQLTYILEHKEIYSAQDREDAAKLYNEVMARKVRTFTLTPNSSVGQYYLAMGMYEAEHQNIKDLTAGRLWGPIYGDEEQIDGTYGFICVEELQKYTRVGNTDNAFYTTYADMMLKDKTLTKSNN